MKRLFILLTVIAACTAVGDQVYKRVGPDGKVYFSDQPGPDAQPVKISPPQTVTLRPVPQQAKPEAAEQPEQTVDSYESFSIVSPTHGQGIRANNGDVTIKLSLKPALKPGHSIALNVAGENGQDAKVGTTTTFEFFNLYRGRHTVTASVLDAEGQELIQTEPVDFHVQRVALGGRGR